MRKTNLILSAAVSGLTALSANAVVLYSASVVRTVDGSAAAGAEAYSLSAGNGGRILFDDAFVARPGSDSLLSLDNIKVGLIHAPLASPTVINVYLAPMLNNTTVSDAGNLGNDPDDIDSDAAPDVGTPTLIASVPYTGNLTAVAQDDLLDIPVSQLLAGNTTYVGKLGFYIGVQFVNDDGTNGWALANTDAPALFPNVYNTFDYTTGLGTTLGSNLDVAWDYATGLDSDEFAVLPPSDTFGPLNTTFYGIASGAIVPEPTAMGALLAGATLLIRRNRRGV